MKPVNQKTINNIDGDCFDACMASILELSDFPAWEKKTSQYIRWNRLLKKHNMQVIYYAIGSHPPPDGYAVLSVKSALFTGGRHAVVTRGDGWIFEIVHNPNPEDPRGVNIPPGDWLGFSVVAIIDPSLFMGVSSI